MAAKGIGLEESDKLHSRDAALKRSVRYPNERQGAALDF